MPLWQALVGFGVLVVVLESVLWRLFHKRIVRICFPDDREAKFFRFFTVLRIRLFAAFHGIFLIACVSLFLWNLW